jgi:hypothetical protein
MSNERKIVAMLLEVATELLYTRHQPPLMTFGTSDAERHCVPRISRLFRTSRRIL